MKTGWYILNYHNISWGSSVFESTIGGSFTPFEFSEHISVLLREFEIVSIDKGLELWENDKIDRPILSFWFDDGLLGTRINAFPILQKINITAGISINSSFVYRKDVFWRFMVSYLMQPRFRNQLQKMLEKKFKYIRIESVKCFCLDNFTVALVDAISGMFYNLATQEEVEIAKNLFDHIQGLQCLQENGWLLANHSANHYPIAEKCGYQYFFEEFIRSEEELSRKLKIENKFLVLPFDRPRKRCFQREEFSSDFPDFNSKVVVAVGNKVNVNGTRKDFLERISVNEFTAKELVRALRKID